MVDEFVYQFTDFCRFRTKDLKKRSPADVELMAQKPKIWDTMQASILARCGWPRKELSGLILHELNTKLNHMKNHTYNQRKLNVFCSEAACFGFFAAQFSIS